MIVTELKGKSQVFTLLGGKTLRILAHESKKIADKSISDELRIAESMGLVLLTKDSKVPSINNRRVNTNG